MSGCLGGAGGDGGTGSGGLGLGLGVSGSPSIFVLMCFVSVETTPDALGSWMERHYSSLVHRLGRAWRVAVSGVRLRFLDELRLPFAFGRSELVKLLLAH